MYIYENANHSLETTDTLENLKILQDVMGKTKDFWSGNKKKHIIILSRCVQRSVKKLFLDTSFAPCYTRLHKLFCVKVVSIMSL